MSIEGYFIIDFTASLTVKKISQLTNLYGFFLERSYEL
jgi:hypothetical protein